MLHYKHVYLILFSLEAPFRNSAKGHFPPLEKQTSWRLWISSESKPKNSIARGGATAFENVKYLKRRCFSDQATTRPSCNLQSDSVAAQQKSAAAGHSRAQPTRAAPDPLTEQDPLPFIPVGVVLVCVISVCVVSVCVVSVCVVSEREAGGAGEAGEAKRDEIQNPTLRCGEKLKETYNRY